MNANAARQNMVDGQLAPGGISDEGLLDLYRVFPRHVFAPDASQAQAYRDGGYTSTAARFSLDPHVEATMLQALSPKVTDIGLVISAGSTPAAGMLSHFLQTVFILETTSATSKKVEKQLVAASLCNTVCFSGGFDKAPAKHGPYNVILGAGACATIPSLWVESLKANGRLCVVERPTPHAPGMIVLIEKDADGTIAKTALRQASIPYLPGLAPQKGFSL